LLEKRDAPLDNAKKSTSTSTASPDNDDITPEIIDRLLTLAHLQRPKDPQELARLERDLRRMRNFLNYIRSTDHQQRQQLAGSTSSAPASIPTSISSSASVESLRSLVDDGQGLRLRSAVDPAVVEKQEDMIQRRDVLLMRPKRIKGNFFVVGTALDKEDN
jgi:hypothetical protein